MLSNDILNIIVYYLDIGEWDTLIDLCGMNVREETIKKKLCILKEAHYQYFTEEEALKAVNRCYYSERSIELLSKIHPSAMSENVCLKTCMYGDEILVIPSNKLNENVYLEAVEVNGFMIKYIAPEHQTPKVCLEAVEENPLAIKYIAPENQTPEVCLAAVHQNGSAIEYIAPENQTPDVCLAAVEENPLAIKYIAPENQTESVIVELINRNFKYLIYVHPKRLTNKLKLYALKKYPSSINYIKIDCEM